MAVFPQKNGTARPIQLLSNRRFALIPQKNDNNAKQQQYGFSAAGKALRSLPKRKTLIFSAVC
jgi:hypothetical protein